MRACSSVVEHVTDNDGVAGSIPAMPTTVVRERRGPPEFYEIFFSTICLYLRYFVNALHRRSYQCNG